MVVGAGIRRSGLSNTLINFIHLYSVLMVVGAGRGPLVRAAISASLNADRKIRKIFAVEKNPNAVIT